MERIQIAVDLEISRVVTGLWQVADMERSGKTLDPILAAKELAAYAEAGFDTFDMADHYGSAEEIIGCLSSLRGTFTAFTKWCPEPAPMTAGVVRAAVDRARGRMHRDRVDLMQLHWWMYEHPAYLDALRELAKLRDEGSIGHIGLTNFNTDHLRLVLACGIPIVTNQVCVSLLDRRALGCMTTLCREHGVKLLAYGTLGGGFLSERYLDVPEPRDIHDWSKLKYGRFIAQIGGWSALQRILSAAAKIARKHDVSIANVATRWVLQQEAVAAIIVGARLGESEHRGDNAKVFTFALDTPDMDELEAAMAQAKSLPGDCGDEYRRPPYLTASGDLSHHLEAFPKVYKAVQVPGRADRSRIDSGSIWESICGYARATRHGNRIFVSGTTATHGAGDVVAPRDPAAQAVYILDKIAASLSSLGGKLEDVVRTRIYLANADYWEAVSRVHGRYFGDIRPANTLLEVSRLIGDYLVEIEAEAIVT
jgi:aryl-alcohol dehydrogenase-like predicted oxidoreductase/enamine deaminase RidA (YjgF/YER057c/UK114 family)